MPKAPSISKFLQRVPLTDFKEAQGTRYVQVKLISLTFSTGEGTNFYARSS